MGVRYAEGVILDLEETWKESDPRTPLICFLSMGSDPTDSIIALGKRLKVETRYVSMGQGQEVHARKLLQQTMANVSRGCEVKSALTSSDLAANHFWDIFSTELTISLFRSLKYITSPLLIIYNIYSLVMMFSCFWTGGLGLTPELSPGSGLHGWANEHSDGDRIYPQKLPSLDNHRGSPTFPNHTFADVNQVYQWTTTGPKGRAQKNLWW